MTILHSIILAIVEGLTEFLPISSTGHLILAQHFLHIPETEFTKTFDVTIQFFAILAVVWQFRRQIILSTKYWKNTFLAFLPTALIGFILYRYIKSYLLGNVYITVYSLFLGGIALLLFDYLYSHKKNGNTLKIVSLSPIRSFTIGLFQTLSVIPGVSRSAASIIGGLSTGLTREQAVEFSFYLAIPTMAAASGYDLLKSNLQFNSSELVILLIGCLLTFISATLAIKTFLNYVKKHNFFYFAVYRIILGVIIFLLLPK